MTAEADQIGPARVPLPDIPAYLRSVYDIGRRSLRPALPALVVLFFYILGTRGYAVLTQPHQHARNPFGAMMAGIAGSLPFFFLIPVLIYPLQESLLRGRPLHFLAAIRRVLEVSVNVLLSGIAQALVLLVPSALLATFGPLPPDPRSLFALSEVAWMLSAFFFFLMIFATPTVVLDGERPLRSPWTSYRLVSRNLGSVLGRFIAIGFLAIVGYAIVTSPAMILSQVAGAPIKLAAVIWESAVDTLFLPFLVAAVLVLYRSLRPSTDEGRA